MLGRFLVFLGGLLVVALFAALLAPFFVNWTDFRSDFETRASRILGQKVTVNGDVEARLLPFPSVTMHDVTVGRDDEGQPLVHVAQFSLDAELAPLLSGEARIFDMRIEQPKVHLKLLEDGTLDWLRGSRADIPARTVVLENLEVVDGQIEFIDEQTGRTRHISGLNADMSAGSLAGPWTVQGHAELDGEAGDFRLSSLQPNEATGALPLKLRLMPEKRPFEVELDGDLAVVDGKPGYSGTFQGVWKSGDGEQETASNQPQPRVRGTFELSNERLRIPDYRLELGDSSNPYAVTGEATLDTGSKPEFLLTADGQQIDVNRIGNDGERGKTGRNASTSVRERLQRLVAIAASIPVPTVPGRASLSLPALVAGDTVIRDIKLDVKPANGGWRIDSSSATFPGRTQVEASGLLTLVGEPSFNGEMLVASTQPTGLASWLTGNVDPAIRQMKRVGFSALVDLTPELQRFEKLELAIGSADLKGRVERQSLADRQANLSFDLSGNAIDLNAIRALGFLIAGDEGGDSLFTHQVGARLKVDKLTAFGIEADNVDTIFTLADGSIGIDKLDIGSIGGTAVQVSGRANGGFEDYSGSAQLSVSADNPGPFLRILQQHLPQSVVFDRLVDNSDWFSNTALSADIAFGDQSGGGLAVRVGGTANGSRIDANLRLANLLEPDGGLQLDATIDNEDTSILLGQAGLRPLPLPADGAGKLALHMQRDDAGPLQTTLDFTTDNTAVKLDAALEGVGGEALSGKGSVSVKSADIDPYLIMNGIALPESLSGLPIDGHSDFTLNGNTLALSGLAADMSGNRVAGDLSLAFADGVPKVTGGLDLGTLDLRWLAENLVGPLSDPLSGEINQSGFVGPIWNGAEAKLSLKADQFLPGVGNSAISGFSTKLDVNGGILVLNDMAGSWFGGNASGRLSLTKADDNGFGELRLQLKGADIASFYGQQGADVPANGKFDLTLAAEGSGKSADELISGFNGSGSLELDDLSVADFNLGLFDPLLAEADKIEGTTIEADVIAPVVTALMSKASAEIGHVSVPFNITGGIARFQNVSVSTPQAQLSADGRIDVRNSTLDADVAVNLDAGEEKLDGADPSFRIILQNDLFTPTASLDVTDLSNYLSLRAFERERRRVETLQSRVLEKQRLRREVMLYRTNARDREEARQKAEALQQEEERKRALAAERAAEAQKAAEEDAARKKAEEDAKREAERILQQSAPAENGDPQRTDTTPDTTSRSMPVNPREGVTRSNSLPPVQLKFEGLPGVN